VEVPTRLAWAREKGYWWPKWAIPSLEPAAHVSVICASVRICRESRAYPDPGHGAPRKDAVFITDSDSGLAVVDRLLVSSHHDTLDPSIETAHDIASTVGLLEIAALHLVDVVFKRL
jgi:hypothetical protein